MKILQLINDLSMGGAQTMCEYLSCALCAMGHEVTVVSFFTDRESAIARRLEEKGARVIFLDKKAGFDPSVVGKLRRVLALEKPQAVHTHLGTFIYYAAATFGKKKGRWIHTVHSMAQFECRGIRSAVAKRYYRAKKAIPVALSGRVQESIAEKYGLGREAIPVIYNGVDLGRCLVKESYAQGEHFTVLHIGRFSAEKNHKGLIAAFALLHQSHPEARLRLVGEGDLWEELEQDVAARGLSPFVEFLGRQENVYPYLHEADVLTLTSTVEGIPMTLAEGMGTGLPIVATAVGGVPDMLTNGENALLCEVDEEQLAQCYARYCEDEALRMRHGRAALARSSVFSAEEMAKKYAALYRGETVLGVTE